MERRENSVEAMKKLGQTIIKSQQKIFDALASKDEIDRKSNLVSVKKQELNWDLIEEDIKGVNQTLEKKGHTILGTHVILDNKSDSMTIETYSQIKSETFKNTLSAKVKSLYNFPEEYWDELQKSGRIELNFTN